MAKVIPELRVKYEVTLKLDEAEARALDALVGYGTDSFLKQFYEFLGKAYLEPHEQGLKRLFQEIREQVGPQLASVSHVRHLMYEDARRRVEEQRALAQEQAKEG